MSAILANIKNILGSRVLIYFTHRQCENSTKRASILSRFLRRPTYNTLPSCSATRLSSSLTHDSDNSSHSSAPTRSRLWTCLPLLPCASLARPLLAGLVPLALPDVPRQQAGCNSNTTSYRHEPNADGPAGGTNWRTKPAYSARQCLEPCSTQQY